MTLRKPWTKSCILVVAMTLVACAPATIRSQPGPSTVEVTDSEVAANIKLAFHDAALEGHERIRVNVMEGNVTLEGKAAPDVADGPLSVILEQVEYGVACRMAILYLLAGRTAEAGAAPDPASSPAGESTPEGGKREGKSERRAQDAVAH